MLFFLMGVCKCIIDVYYAYKLKSYLIAITGYITLSGAFASYYWSMNKNDVPFFALLFSFSRCVRYHLGSVAFGSLLVAVVRFIRIILEYIDNKCKKYANNIVVKAILW